MRSQALLVLCALICGSVAAVLPKRDKTITIPDDVQWHPETQDICTATQWTDVVSFFLGNYLTHAATVVKFPGEPFYITFLNMILVILFPCLGAGRGLLVIFRRAIRFKHPLQQALHSQALAMVVRTQEWEPKDGDLLRSLSLRPDKVRRFAEDSDQYWRIAYGQKNIVERYNAKLKNYIGKFKMLTEIPPWLLMNYGWTTKHIFVLKGYVVAGHHELPEGYGLAYVPSNALVEDTMAREELERIITPSYDLASGIIAIVQIIFACSTLYKSQGYQINVYGYAAFGFTVLPYLFMSFINLVGTCATPSFSELYLVHTEMMDEAIQRGGKFTDVVGKIESEPLAVKNLIVFPGAFQQNEDEMQCRLGDKLYKSGSTEPMSCDSLFESEHMKSSETEPFDANDSATSLPSEKTIGEDGSQEAHTDQEKEIDCDDSFCPIIINPACYAFKLAYQNTSSTSIAHRNRHYGPRSTLFAAGVWLTAALPLIPIGIMSQFKAHDSTLAQRCWLMAWYAVGIVSVSNPFFSDWIAGHGIKQSAELIKLSRSHPGMKKLFDGLTRLDGPIPVMISFLGYLAIFATPAIGRFVVVGQQLVAYGSCTGL